MRDDTVIALNQINKQFYHAQSQSWHGSRSYFWPSWKIFWDSSSAVDKEAVSVLDVGCGTGRFLQFCEQQKLRDFSYLGLDSSQSLLNIAQENEANQLDNDVSWSQVDIVSHLLHNASLHYKKFSIVVAFGILHHIPSQRLRVKFLEELAKLALPGAELWLTSWQPQRTNQRLPALADPQELAVRFMFDYDDLESGDVFIGWRSSPNVRYVHWLTENEEECLFPSKYWQVDKRWEQTTLGERGNLCWLLKRQG